MYGYNSFNNFVRTTHPKTSPLAGTAGVRPIEAPAEQREFKFFEPKINNSAIPPMVMPELGHSFLVTAEKMNIADYQLDQKTPILFFQHWLYGEIFEAVTYTTKKYNTEMAWYFLYKQIAQGVPHYEAFGWFMTGQTASGGEVDLEGSDLPRYIQYLQEKYPEQNYRLGHGHSHNTMGTFFSGTDDKQQHDRSQLAEMSGERLYVVVNNKKSMLGRYINYCPYHKIDNMPIGMSSRPEVFGSPTKERRKEIQDMVDNLLIAKQFAPWRQGNTQPTGAVTDKRTESTMFNPLGNHIDNRYGLWNSTFDLEGDTSTGVTNTEDNDYDLGTLNELYTEMFMDIDEALDCGLPMIEDNGKGTVPSIVVMAENLQLFIEEELKAAGFGKTEKDLWAPFVNAVWDSVDIVDTVFGNITVPKEVAEAMIDTAKQFTYLMVSPLAEKHGVGIPVQKHTEKVAKAFIFVEKALRVLAEADVIGAMAEVSETGFSEDEFWDTEVYPRLTNQELDPYEAEQLNYILLNEKPHKEGFTLGQLFKLFIF